MGKSLPNKLKEKIWEKIENIHTLFLDILFPVECLACGSENEWLCDKCLSNIKLQTEQTCPLCEKVSTPDGRTCFACKKNSSLDALLVCASYREKIISKTVHNFKYRFVENLSVPLGKIMVQKIAYSDIPLPDLLLPIPLHSKRLRWRGFNQASLLTKRLSAEIAPGIEIPISENILFRTRFTRAQMKIKNYQQRRANIRNAFEISDPEKIKGKTILLIDDIATTGATLFECAKTLKENGAREVFAIVIARQEMRVSN